MRRTWAIALCLAILGCSRPDTQNIEAEQDTQPVCEEFDTLAHEPVPDDTPFVIVTDLDSTILTDIRYATGYNFVGKPLDGYLQPIAILSRKAAQALVEANKELKQKGLTILIYDAYRPQRAVDHIYRWSKNSSDTLTRSIFYPHISKHEIRCQGYISKRSKHAMGSTVDLTLCDIYTHEPLDMGSPFDLLDPVSNFSTNKITPEQRANRVLLRTTMSRHGFYPIEGEWWHFTLRKQPFDHSFDFPVHADSARLFRL